MVKFGKNGLFARNFIQRINAGSNKQRFEYVVVSCSRQSGNAGHGHMVVQNLLYRYITVVVYIINDIPGCVISFVSINILTLYFMCIVLASCS